MEEIKNTTAFLLGDQKSGKTSLFNRYFYDTFSTDYKITIGIDFKFTKQTSKEDGHEYVFRLMDTRGQESFRSSPPVNFLRMCDTAIIVLDISTNDYNEIVHTLEYWKRYALEQSLNNTLLPIVVVLSKIDTMIYSNSIDKLDLINKMKQYCKENGDMHCVTTSALSNTNIDLLFQLVIDLSYNHKSIKLKNDYLKQQRQLNIDNNNGNTSIDINSNNNNSQRNIVRRYMSCCIPFIS